MRWNPGDIIVLRGVLKGKLWWACPAYVVQDTPQLLALYWPAGTPTRSPVKRPTVEDGLYNRIELQPREWTDHDILSLNTPGAAHSVELMWLTGTCELRYWYVHLQEALRRTSIGFDTMDQMLDIVFTPDRTCWYWKDEDEFSQAEATGLYSPEKAAGIRAEGERVIAMMKADLVPFCDHWEDWTPPEDWSIPQFPAGWEDEPLEN